MKQIAIRLIRAYQRGISPLRPPSCRFIPTCSVYAIQAITRFGVMRGGLLAVWRILRCNPWGRFGYDPVPHRYPLPRRKQQMPKAGETGDK